MTRISRSSKKKYSWPKGECMDYGPDGKLFQDMLDDALNMLYKSDRKHLEEIKEGKK